MDYESRFQAQKLSHPVFIRVASIDSMGMVTPEVALKIHRFIIHMSDGMIMSDFVPYVEDEPSYREFVDYCATANLSMSPTRDPGGARARMTGMYDTFCVSVEFLMLIATANDLEENLL